MTEPNSEDEFDGRFEGDDLDDDVDIEAPEADMLEQHTAARQDRARAARREAPLEANAADAADQDLDVEPDDEDEYR